MGSCQPGSGSGGGRDWEWRTSLVGPDFFLASPLGFGVCVYTALGSHLDAGFAAQDEAGGDVGDLGTDVGVGVDGCEVISGVGVCVGAVGVTVSAR